MNHEPESGSDEEFELINHMEDEAKVTTDLEACTSKKLDDDRQIKCPHCGYVLTDDDLENWSEHVSYWGEDSAKETECIKCEKTYHVREWVDRTWVVGKTEKEASEI